MKLTTSTFIWRLVISIAAALAIAAAFPQTVFAQSDPLTGTWNLNLAKSTYCCTTNVTRRGFPSYQITF